MQRADHEACRVGTLIETQSCLEYLRQMTKKTLPLPDFCGRPPDDINQIVNLLGFTRDT